MSIVDEIKAHVTAGRLVKHAPLQIRTPIEEIRELYYLGAPIEHIEGPTIHDQFNGNLSAREELRWLEAEQVLDDFVTAARISIPLDSRRAGEAFMSRLDPPAEEVWDIRAIDPTPGLRFLGRFAEKDVFIALSWDYRERLGSDYEWGFAKRRSLMAWSFLFPNQNALTGGYPNDYLTGSYFSTDRVQRAAAT